MLPTIQQSYRDGSSKAQFRYSRPHLVHNSRLLDGVNMPYSVFIALLNLAVTTYTHTTVLLLFWNLSGTTQVSRYQKGKTRKGKTNLDLLEQEIVSGSGICWVICKSAPYPRQPCQHHTTQFFTGRMPFLPPNQRRQSTVTLVDRLKILETNCTNNLPNIFALHSPKIIHLLPGEHGEILGGLEMGWEKVACWSTKAAISLSETR